MGCCLPCWPQTQAPSASAEVAPSALVAAASSTLLDALSQEERQAFVARVQSRPGQAYYHFKSATPAVRADKACILAAVKACGKSLYYASDDMKADKDVIMAAVKQDGSALLYVDKHAKIWNDEDFVLPMVTMHGYQVIEHVSPNLQRDKRVWVAVVQQDGNSLQHAPEEFRKDKEVVLAAVRKSPASLKFALSGLNQEHECLKVSGIWDQENVAYCRPERVTLSLRFSLAEAASPYATEFALALKKDEFLKTFKAYNPNAWEKDSCDPFFTDMNHKCRGTLDTCSVPKQDNLGSDMMPTSKSCWRFAFHFHQEESKATNGFMIQVEEFGGLGAGQQIETKMAEQVGLKIFRTRTNFVKVSSILVGKTSEAVKAWYSSGCQRKGLEIIMH